MKMKVFVVIKHEGCDNPWCPGTQPPSSVFSSRKKAEAFARKLQSQFREVEVKEMEVK